MRITAKGLSFRALNQLIRECVQKGAKEIEIVEVNGQRYIGAGIDSHVIIVIQGTPGNDLGAFAQSPKIIVYGNAEDGVGNTMDNGEIFIHGNAGDIVGYSMRGGKIYIKGNAGYRVGIHMKEYRDHFPIIVIGGIARDFLGEYMAGGRIIVLGLNGSDEEIVGEYVGTGMHGGKIFVRGKVCEDQLGTGVGIKPMTNEDWAEIKGLLTEYCAVFKTSLTDVLENSYTKIVPTTYRPYEKTYILT